MKKVIQLLSIVLIFSVLASCEKEGLAKGEARLEGRLLENGTNKPLAGWTVYFSSCDCEFLVGCDCEVRDSMVTDIDGNFSYQYDYDAHGHVFAYPKVQEGFYKYDYRVLGPYKERKVTTKDIKVIPEGWIKFHIINDKPFNQSDVLYLSGNFHSTIYNKSFYGSNVDLFHNALVDASDSIVVRTSIIKNSKNTTFDRKVWVKAHDTTFFEIKY